jgi:hypothetical protein
MVFSLHAHWHRDTRLQNGDSEGRGIVSGRVPGGMQVDLGWSIARWKLCARTAVSVRTVATTHSGKVGPALGTVLGYVTFIPF